MAALLRVENNLVVLRIRLDRSATDLYGSTRGATPSAVFELQEGGGESVPLAEVPVSELGLEGRLRGDEHPSLFHIPESAGARIRDLVPPDRVLWLELPSPAGLLRLLPWEAMLGRIFEGPVLRLPYCLLRPEGTGSSLEIAVIASSPRAKFRVDTADMLQRYLDAVRAAVPVPLRFHVFADAEKYEELLDVFDSKAGIVVRNPQEAEQFEPAVRSPGLSGESNLRSPWLRWVQAALGGQALDAVQFICHGYYSGDRGALALASSPLLNTDREWSRFIAAPELNTFLTVTGAWTACFTGPFHDYAPMGRRELADSLAQIKPLAVLSHDLESDPTFHELASAYGLILGGAPRPVRRMGSVSLWLHPQFVPDDFYQSMEGSLLDPSGRTTLVGPATKMSLNSAATPAWIAAGARALEQIQGELLATLKGASGRDADAESSHQIEHALEAAADILERHVVASQTGGTPGTPPEVQ